MMNRRGLLKLLGIGTAVAPIANGVPLIKEAALLVEPAKVELVTSGPPPKAGRGNGWAEVSMTFEGVTYHMTCMVTELEMFTDPVEVDVTSHSDSYRRFVPGRLGGRLKFTGEIIPPVNLHIGG